MKNGQVEIVYKFDSDTSYHANGSHDVAPGRCGLDLWTKNFGSGQTGKML